MHFESRIHQNSACFLVQYRGLENGVNVDEDCGLGKPLHTASYMGNVSLV
jgi:ankyrin repeat protein